MGDDLERLALRRETLLLKSQAQRDLMVLHGRELKKSLEGVDLIWQLSAKAGSEIRRHPSLGVALAALVLALKPRRAASLLKTALSGWQIWRGLAPLLRRFRSSSATE